MTTLDKDVREFTAWLASWGAAKATIDARVSMIRSALRVWPADPRTADLAAWLGRDTLAPWTRVTYYSHVRSWFSWRVESGRATSDPSRGLRAPRAPRDVPRPLTRVQARQVVDAARGDTRASVLLGLYAGLRAHEIAKLRGEDVDEDSIYVLGKGGQAAFVPTHPVLWDLAQEYPRRGFWFPAGNGLEGHVHAKTVTSRVSRLFAVLGVEGSLHRCRHSYGTELLRKGANIRVVQELMRHQNLSVTARYLAVSEDERSSAIRSLVA